MTNNQETPTITIDGKNYSVSDLAEESKVLINVLQENQQLSNAKQAEFRQLQIAAEAIRANLLTTLEGVPFTEEAVEPTPVEVTE